MDKDAKLKLSDCEKEFKRILFEEAIDCEEINVSALDRFGDIDEIVVEDTYYYFFYSDIFKTNLTYYLTQ